jgi:hypothetical protein
MAVHFYLPARIDQKRSEELRNGNSAILPEYFLFIIYLGILAACGWYSLQVQPSDTMNLNPKIADRSLVVKSVFVKHCFLNINSEYHCSPKGESVGPMLIPRGVPASPVVQGILAFSPFSRRIRPRSASALAQQRLRFRAKT